MADKAHIATDKKLAVMEKRISAIYSEAQEDLQKKADKYFKQFEEADQKKRKLVEQGKLTEDEYKKWRKGKIARGKQFTAMKEQVAENLLHTNEIAIAYINGEIPDVYALGYNAIAPTVEGVGGYSFTLVDGDTVRTLATTDTSLLPYKKLNPAKDTAWNMQKINSQVAQGILQGESIPKIAKRISRVQEMNKESAVRTARTIVTGAENKGRMDSYKRAEADGIILRKYWLATYDKRGRDWHKDAGNDYTEEKAIEIDDFFIVDGEKMLHPGDAMHGASGHNLYNCRCSIASKVVGFNKVQVQKAMEQPKVFHEEDYRAFETGEQTNDFFYYDDEKRGLMARKKSAHGQWTSGLSQEEARVIGQYCADGYYDINNYWRKYGDWQDINAERVKHQTEMLDGVIARYDLKEPIKVYRAIQPEAFESYWDDIPRIVGTEYTDAGFMSTSPIKTSTAVNKDCIMELFIPSGKGRGAYVNNVSGFQDEEYEFLLARDSKFRVIGAEETEDKLILKMEWIGNGQ